MILPEKIPFNKISYHQYDHTAKRVSLCIPGHCIGTYRGSITIEAALVLPLFFLAAVSLCYMLEVMAVRTSIRAGMQYAGKKAAEQAYLKPVASVGTLEKDIVEAIGAGRLGRSVVEGGSGGLHCEESRMSVLTAVMDIKVTYNVYLPVPVFGRVTVPMEESCKVKGWNGYEKTGFSGADDTTVYITETGMVYHLDYHCNYLELSIRMVSSDSVEDLRNKSDGKYHPCERCGHGGSGGVYITDYGDRYHTSLDCSGLKRTVYAVPLSEAAGKGACSKCGS